MKNKTLKNLFILFLSLILISAVPLTEALACTNYADYNCHYMINGVGSWGSYNRFYWMSPSTRANYSNLVDEAVDSWVSTTSRLNYSTSISILETTIQDNAMFEVHSGNYQSKLGGSPGGTEFYISGGTLLNNGGAPTQNWVWAKILLNDPVLSNASSNNKQGTIAHEFGHAMGLDHCPMPYGGYYTDRIMCPSNKGRTVYEPTRMDLNVIRHLYP